MLGQQQPGHLVVALHIVAAVTLLPGVVLAQAVSPTPPPAPAPAAAPSPDTAPAPAGTVTEPAPAAADAPAPPAAAAAAAAADSAAADTAKTAAPAGAAPPAAPAAPVDPDPTKGHVLDTTAYVLPGGTAEFGLWYMGYGVTKWLSIGTSPGLWVVGPLVGGLVANVSAKVGVPLAPWVDVGLEATPIYLRVNRDGATTRGFVLPTTLAATFKPTDRFDFSLGGRYVAITGKDESSTESQDVEGAVVTSLAQITADSRYRFTEKFGLYLRGYFEFWEKNLGAHGVYQPDDSTTIEVEGEADPNENSRPWAIIVGTHLRFGNVNLRVGGGYGNFFVPRIGAFTPEKTFVPDLDFYVRF